MKTYFVDSIQTVLYTLMLVFILPTCSQAGKGGPTQATAKKPKMDLHSAVIAGNIDVVKQHIEAGSDINAKEPFGGSTPLITAVTFDKPSIAKLLIDAGADLSIKNNDGSTPLHVAAFFCRTDMVKMLIEAKADPTMLNNFGATPKQTVMGSFAEMKPIYEMIGKQLEPMGLKLDIDRIEKTRPAIVGLLQ